MSTRANIAVATNEGIKSIYCHSDGYPNYTGHLLNTYYHPRRSVEAWNRNPRLTTMRGTAIYKTIDELIALGDLSLLGAKVHPDPDRPHSFMFGERQPNVTVAYHRDRGNKADDSDCWIHATLSDWHQSMWPGIDYAYLFAGGEWLCAEVTDPADGLFVLQDVALMINYEQVQQIFGSYPTSVNGLNLGLI